MREPDRDLLQQVDWDGPSGLRRMRHDWDRRALAQAEQAVYTRDAETDVEDFDRSGQANYDQLVRPFLPILLDGRPSRSCRVAEIGCGIGRMTRCFAEAFGEVDALDISQAMIDQANERLGDRSNLRFHLSSGDDLAPLPDAAFDLVFSYIVFQHIPSKRAIENYMRETSRVLKSGGVLKFQLNGDQSAAYREHEPDTWQGVAYSFDEARSLLDRYGLSLLAAEGIGSQYFVLTARKGALPRETGDRCYILAGEAWSGEQLLEGFGEPVGQSWRPLGVRGRARLRVPRGGACRFFTGIYFWPEQKWQTKQVHVLIEGRRLGTSQVEQAGDHYLEFDAPHLPPESTVISEIEIHPKPGKDPAVRCMGFVAGSREAV